MKKFLKSYAPVLFALSLGALGTLPPFGGSLAGASLLITAMTGMLLLWSGSESGQQLRRSAFRISLVISVVLCLSQLLLMNGNITSDIASWVRMNATIGIVSALLVLALIPYFLVQAFRKKLPQGSGIFVRTLKLASVLAITMVWLLFGVGTYVTSAALNVSGINAMISAPVGVMLGEVAKDDASVVADFRDTGAEVQVNEVSYAWNCDEPKVLVVDGISLDTNEADRYVLSRICDAPPQKLIDASTPSGNLTIAE